MLDGAGARCWLFGGWAEEMRGLSAPRSHRDVDLLYAGTDFDIVEALVVERRLHEIAGKRFPHKRAFFFDGVMVELFLVQRDSAGLFTSFWGNHRRNWPADTLSSAVGMPVASASALENYRNQHASVVARDS